MGALAPVSHWIPKDDLLLKNAVEAGASLESLAKGAVQFSQRFTVRELEDRWYSLLYDPVVSTEASACMIEYERSASPSKFNRFSNLKENKSVNGKRKTEGVRSCYYALRKRICSEPFDSRDLSFLVAPINDDYVGNGDEPPSGSWSGGPISNSFNFEGSEMDTMHHTFAQNLMDGGDAASHAFHTGFINHSEGFPCDPNNIKKEIPPTFEDDVSLAGNGAGVEELGHQNRLQECSLFETEDTFDQINDNQQNICSDFEENRVFNSPTSEYGGPFSNVEYSSPLPGISIWRTVAAPELPVDLSIQENNLSGVDTFELPGDYDVNNTGTSVLDIQSDVKVKTEMPFDDFRGDTNTEGYFAELSNSLLNFTNEEELMCVDGKDMIDKSYFDGLSSLLLSSPNGGSHDQMINLAEAEASVGPDMCIMNSSVPCLMEPDENGVSHKDDNKIICNVETIMQSSISASVQFPELKGGFIFCTLNSEDSEVPDNDDVFLINNLPQAFMSSVTEHKEQEASNQISSSVRHFSVGQRTNDRGTSLMHKEQKIPGELHVSSQKIGSHVSQEMVLNCGVKLEHSASDSSHLVSRLAGDVNGTDQISAAKLSTEAPLPQTLNDEGKPSKNLNSNDCFIEKPAFEHERLKNCTLVQSSGMIKEEQDVSDATKDHQASHEPAPMDTSHEPAPMDTSHEPAPMDIVIAETVLHPPATDQETDLVESDNDVPNYSDIEAMILDTDLDPDDQDLFSSEEVSRYQLEETKRAIIRLEQGANSYMKRAIASHGAIAILYGRHSKHYIKKSEVLLGRATEDIAVDIDLGRECRANKVSRRQAIIKLEKCGSFYLKNLGKCVITVNSKEVGPRQSTSLNSSCLIEIRGLPFIFETNRTSVKQYLENKTMVTQTQ